MTLFPRPDSPPPRSPSPEVVLAPLPPPIRRRTPSSRPARLSLQTSDERPKFERPHPQRPIASMRSVGDLRRPPTPRTASSSRSVVSAPPTPRSLVPSSPSSQSRGHKRNLSFAVPYRSPPASPTFSSPPPPVPPIPEFVLSPTDKKPVLHPAASPRSVTSHIYLPEWEQFSVTPDLAAPPPRKRRVSSISPSSSRRAVAVGASAGAMTCATFMALHNQNQRPQHVAAL
ncbi:hypothetical protein R3P38DRAFT_3171867 [Favolaschia claudopus]|uniref:Uncharacterized protein n=1 Tax=Favolaschia claudopus TaxID=2862362 RepID=A0AAW0DNQ9_9AGAR